MQGEVIVTLKFYNTVFCELAEVMANENVDLNLKFLSVSIDKRSQFNQYCKTQVAFRTMCEICSKLTTKTPEQH